MTRDEVLTTLNFFGFFLFMLLLLLTYTVISSSYILHFILKTGVSFTGIIIPIIGLVLHFRFESRLKKKIFGFWGYLVPILFMLGWAAVFIKVLVSQVR